MRDTWGSTSTHKAGTLAPKKHSLGHTRNHITFILEWSNNHSILVVLKAKYEQLLRKLKETPTTETVEQQSISSEREEFNAFLWDVIKSIKHLPTHEVKHCDSRFRIHYVSTDPYICKAICSEEKWHHSTCLIPAFSSENYAIRPINHQEYHWKGRRYNQNYRLAGR